MLFLFCKCIRVLSANSLSLAEASLDAFREGFTCCGLRIALGPLRGLARCLRKGYRFTDVYVDRALEYRKRYKSGRTGPDKAAQRDLLSNVAQATDDSHAIRKLARHAAISAGLRAEILALGDEALHFDSLPRLQSV